MHAKRLKILAFKSFRGTFRKVLISLPYTQFHEHTLQLLQTPQGRRSESDVIVGVCLTVSVASADPFILRTEMNANGTVEYLCLGNACENLAAMDW